MISYSCLQVKWLWSDESHSAEWRATVSSFQRTAAAGTRAHRLSSSIYSWANTKGRTMTVRLTQIKDLPQKHILQMISRIPAIKRPRRSREKSRTIHTAAPDIFSTRRMSIAEHGMRSVNEDSRRLQEGSTLTYEPLLFDIQILTQFIWNFPKNHSQ